MRARRTPTAPHHRLGPLLLLALVLLGAGPPGAGRRVALLIGNGAYRSMARLPNPGNDAQAIGQKLQGMGFDVTVVVDREKKAMDEALQAFYHKGRGAAVALLFYAGHGIQSEGRNYLIPVDAEVPDDEADLHRQAVELEFVVGQLQKSAQTSLVFLDACRNNPGLTARTGATREAFREVRLAEVPRGTMMVLYAASRGRTALDAVDGDKNSPFASALLQYLGEPDPVEVLVRRVTRRVREKTADRQRPEMQGNLDEEIRLIASPTLAASAPPPAALVLPAPAVAPPEPALTKAASAQGKDERAAMLAPLQRQIDATRDDDPQKPILLYRKADLLFRIGSLDSDPKERWFCDAAPLFSRVLQMDHTGLDPKEAAYSAVLAWTRCLDAAAGGAEGALASARADRREEEPSDRPGAPPTTRPLPAEQERLQQAMDLFLKHATKSEDDQRRMLAVKWRRARAFYDLNHFKEAAPLFRDIAENHAKDELAHSAANLLLDCLVFQGDYKEVAQQTERLLVLQQGGALRDKQLGQRLASLQRNFRRRAIEQFERDGEWRLAAIGYMQLADRDPNDPKYDELLYNASICFQRSKLIGLALQARERLLRERPTSPLARRALFRNAQAYHFTGFYEDAAERYERFFERYPEELAGENEDPDARIDAAAGLHTAAVFRRGLGQTELYIADVNRFVQRYGARKERFDEAAGLFFDVGQVYDQKKDYARLRQHLIDYLKLWGQKGGIDRQIIAEVKLGEIAWRESCPVAVVNGACIQVERARAAAPRSPGSKQRLTRGGGSAGPRQCGAETKSKITVFDRKPALVQEAMARFQRAQRLFASGAAVNQVPFEGQDLRVANLIYHVALARMAEGDKEYESLLRSKVPVGLVFDPRQPQLEAESRRRFQSWLKERSQRLQEIKTIYQEVLRFQSVHFVIAAAARIGQLYQDFASGLAAAEVPQVPAPPGVDRGAFAAVLRASYCRELRAAAEPLEDEAEGALSTCLATSTALDWFSEWSKLCEVELNQMKPRRYPLAAELRAEPGYQRPGMDLATTLGAPPQ